MAWWGGWSDEQLRQGIQGGSRFAGEYKSALDARAKKAGTAVDYVDQASKILYAKQAEEKAKQDAAKEEARQKSIAAGGVSGNLIGLYGAAPTERQQDLISGSQFGEAVLGKGLGRLGEDADIQGTLARLKSLSQGMSAPEEQARREQALAQINTGSQSQQRALQAQLARSGVKGAAAGAQNTQVVNANIAARGNLEQNLMAQKSDMERRGLQDYSNALSNVKTFDLKQAAKEKDIVLQAGLGQAAAGEAEKAKKAAEDRLKKQY